MTDNKQRTPKAHIALWRKITMRKVNGRQVMATAHIAFGKVS